MTQEEVKEFKGFLEKYDSVRVDVNWEMVQLHPLYYKTSDFKVEEYGSYNDPSLTVEVNGDVFSNTPYGVGYYSRGENRCQFYYGTWNNTTFTFYNEEQ